MDTQDLIDHFGTLTNAAKAIGTSIQVVSAWNTKNRIPLGRQYEIQVLTGGKLRANPARQVSPKRRSRREGVPA